MYFIIQHLRYWGNLLYGYDTASGMGWPSMADYAYWTKIGKLRHRKRYELAINSCCPESRWELGWDPAFWEASPFFLKILPAAKKLVFINIASTLLSPCYTRLHPCFCKNWKPRRKIAVSRPQPRFSFFLQPAFRFLHCKAKSVNWQWGGGERCNCCACSSLWGAYQPLE